MSNKRFSLRAIIIAVVATFLLTGGLGILAARYLIGPGGLAMLQGLRLIETRFVGEYDEEKLVDEALGSMVSALDDRWSVYMDPAWREAVEQMMQNAYVGIGVTYQKSEEPLGMELIEVVADSPAAEAGLKAGEYITAVNGQALTEENFDSLVERIGGREGQTVTLTVMDADGETREVELTARRVDTPPVEYALLEGGVGYVRLKNFYENAASFTQDAVDDLVAQGAKGLLFDVRGNPGGYVKELTALLDYLLPEGPIFAEQSKNGAAHVTESDAECIDLPMVVLVDGDSYSAAELFAAQLRESVGAKLVGQKTCGKGYYQQGFPLANGGELHISTGLYTTGEGVSLIGTGLTPDYVVEGAEAQRAKGEAIAREEIEKG